MVKITEMPAGVYIFSPETLKIKVGTEVVWTNDTVPGHTVTSDTGAFKGSDVFGQNQTFTTIFTQPGTFHYHCALHIYMKGTIIVS
jgi:plastocyanin